MSIVLPTKPIPSITQDPKNLIIYGVPKVNSCRLAQQYALLLSGKNGKNLFQDNTVLI